MVYASTLKDCAIMIQSFNKKLFQIISAAIILATAFPYQAQADRIKDFTSVAGQRPNQLVGYGLVMGLDGSGDQTTQTPFTIQSVLQMLNVLGITVPTTGTQSQLRNTAAVMVTAELPALGRPGQPIDVTVSSIGNSTSLKGGTLVMTPLRAADGQVYAQAQGSVVISGASAKAGGAATTVNHLSAGRIPGGGLIERAVPSLIPDEFVQLDLQRADFSLMQKTTEAIGRRFGLGTALPMDAHSIQVRVPLEPLKRAAFMATLEQIEVEPVSIAAKFKNWFSRYESGSTFITISCSSWKLDRQNQSNTNGL